MVFKFRNAGEARDALVARMLVAPAMPAVPIVPGRDGARLASPPRCDACGNVGATKRVDGTQIVCVDAAACCSRYRLGQSPAHYAAALRADLRAATDQRVAASVERVMGGAL